MWHPVEPWTHNAPRLPRFLQRSFCAREDGRYLDDELSTPSEREVIRWVEGGEDDGFCSYCNQLMQTQFYDAVVAVVCSVNTYVIVAQMTQPSRIYFCADQVLLCCLIVDLVRRWYHLPSWLREPPHVCFWILFDIVILGVGLLDVWVLPALLPLDRELSLQKSGILRKLRLLLVVRVFRVLWNLDFSFVNGSQFQSFMGAVIVCNSLLMGVETDYHWPIWFYVEQLFLVLYTFELFAHVRREGGYFLSSDNKDMLWNVLDSLIVLSSILDSWVLPLISILQDTESDGGGHGGHVGQLFMMMRMLRLMRILRLLKLVKSVRPLLQLVNGILSALQGISWVLVLTVILLYAMGIVATRLVGHGLIFHDKQPDEMVKPFRTLPDSMFTLFRTMAGNLSDEESNAIDSIMEHVAVVKFIFVFFLVASSWTLLSILTAVVSDTMITMHQEDKRNEFLKQDQALHTQALMEVFSCMDENGDGIVQQEEVIDFLAVQENANKTATMCRVPARDLLDVLKSLCPDGCSINMRNFAEHLIRVGNPVTEKSIMKIEAHLQSVMEMTEQEVRAAISQLLEDRSQRQVDSSQSKDTYTVVDALLGIESKLVEIQTRTEQLFEVMEQRMHNLMVQVQKELEERDCALRKMNLVPEKAQHISPNSWTSKLQMDDTELSNSFQLLPRAGLEEEQVETGEEDEIPSERFMWDDDDDVDDDGAHKCLHFADTRCFRASSAFGIAVNSALVAAEIHNPSATFFWIHRAFACYCVVEVLCGLCFTRHHSSQGRVHRIIFSTIDFLSVASGFVEQWLLPTNLHGQRRFLQGMQLLRTFRLCSMMPGLQCISGISLKWIEGPAFQGLMGAVIAINSIILGLETDTAWDGWAYFESILLVIYTVELSLNILHHGAFFISPTNSDIMWNLIDFTIVTTSVLDSWIMPLFAFISIAVTGDANTGNKSTGFNNMMVLMRLMRLMRILRLAKLVKSVPPLLRLVEGMAAALSGVGWVLVLTVIMLYSMGIVATRLIGHRLAFPPNSNIPDSVVYPFRSVPQSTFTLFRIMNGASSDEESGAVDSIMQNAPLVKIGFIFFMVVSSWLVLSVVTAVVSENMISLHQEAARIASLHEDVTIHKENLRDLFACMDENGDGMVAKSEIEEFLSDPENARVTAERCRVPVRDVLYVLRTICDDNHPVQLSSFIELLVTVGEPVTERSMMKLEARIKDILHAQEEHVDKLVREVRLTRLHSSLQAMAEGEQTSSTEHIDCVERLISRVEGMINNHVFLLKRGEQINNELELSISNISGNTYNGKPR